MSSDLGPVVQRALLSGELTRLRREVGRTQDDVAKALDWSVSKVIRIEGGTVGTSTTDLQALLRLYEVSDDGKVEQLTRLAKGTRERGWWASYPIEDQQFRTYLGYEAGASCIRMFHPSLVPGLLQTMDYARVVLRQFVRGANDERIEVLAGLRVERQDKLAERDPVPHRHFILDEAVVRRHVGALTKNGRGIMPAQLRHMVEVVRDGHVTIQIIPFSKGAHFGMKGPFTLLEFDADLGEVLYLEGARGGDLILTGREEQIINYRANFEELEEWTLSQEESSELMLRIADEMGAA
ncbi:helix-turn-helix transcriptional regulator [Actinocorallia libanotica]|uniref:Helix-turn-helix transcriptional regulator n=1 Tax=Actinocorallia libanotica TaxID=46162 RepID=A0ABP4BFC1_9ACTN